MFTTPTPADESCSLEAYRAAWTRAQLATDRPLAMRTAGQVRRRPWPTLRAEAENLCREIDLACFGDGDMAYGAAESVTITRENLYTRGRLRPFSWLYTVHVDGETFTGEGIGWARRLAKAKANGRPVVEVWKVAQASAFGRAQAEGPGPASGEREEAPSADASRDSAEHVSGRNRARPRTRAKPAGRSATFSTETP